MEGAAEAGAEGAADDERAKRQPTMSNGDLLLVDDDPDLLKLISLRLASAGYRVRSVDSGEAALAAIAVTRPALVITDLRMPGIDGLQLFESIHRQYPASHHRGGAALCRHGGDRAVRHCPAQARLGPAPDPRPLPALPLRRLGGAEPAFIKETSTIIARG